jgi:hypothetical protein
MSIEALADSQVMEREDAFWRWARVCAVSTGDRWKSYEALKAQYAGIRPDATHTEYEAAMKRLADLLGI